LPRKRKKKEKKMAGGTDSNSWWKAVQVGESLEIFVVSDQPTELEPRRKSQKGRDSERSPWCVGTISSIEGNGLRAKVVVNYTDPGGKVVQETIALRDSGAGRLRPLTQAPVVDVIQSKSKKGKRDNEAVNENDQVAETVSAAVQKVDSLNSVENSEAGQRIDIVGMRVKVLYDDDIWYDGVIRSRSKKNGEYRIVFEDDEEIAVVLPSPDGDAELVLPKEDLCGRITMQIQPPDGLIYGILHSALVKTRNLKSNQELPLPYSQLLSAAGNAITRQIRCQLGDYIFCPLLIFIIAFPTDWDSESKTPVLHQIREGGHRDGGGGDPRGSRAGGEAGPHAVPPRRQAV
jgi:hypothetical protein